MISPTLVYVGLAILGVIIFLAALCFAVVMLCVGVFDPDDDDSYGEFQPGESFPTEARWPNDKLSREYGNEYEPRGM